MTYIVVMYHLAKALPSLARLRVVEAEEGEESASTLFLPLGGIEDFDAPLPAI